MDDLSATISQILSDPEKVKQFQAMASSLGIGEGSAPPAQTPPPGASAPDLSALTELLSNLGNSGQNAGDAAPSPAITPDLSVLSGLLGNLGNSGQTGNAAASSSTNTPDLSALTGLLGGLGGGQTGNTAASPDLAALSGLLGGQSTPGGATPDLSALAGLLGGNGGGTPDLSSLSGLLSGLTGSGNGQQSTANAATGFDVGALAGLLRSGNPPSAADSQPSGGFDMGMLFKLQQAMANVQQNKANIELLLALKPRLSEARAKKVDDAIRVMQLIQFLPLLKETGLFGEMDSLLSGLGGLGGGFGSMLGGIGNSVGGLLGGLTGRGGRR